MESRGGTRGERGDDPRQQIGPAIRQLRRRRGWSIDELAERARVSASYLSRLERGASVPSFWLLARVATVLGVDANYFASFDRASREYDRDLRACLAALGVPESTWHEFAGLGLEARGALRDLLRRLTEAKGLAATKQRALEQLILDHGVRETVPEILAAIREYGLSPLDYGRSRAQIEEFPGDRRVIGSRLSTVPGSHKFDEMQIFQLMFGVEVPTSLIKWWNSSIRTSLNQTLAANESRSILPIRAIERYIEHGYWGSRLPFAPDVVREHVEATVRLLRANGRYQIGLVPAPPPVGFVLKGEGAGIAYRLGETRVPSPEAHGVALRFYGSAVTNRFREYFEELWAAIPAHLREPAAVANWIEAKLNGTAPPAEGATTREAAPTGETDTD